MAVPQAIYRSGERTTVDYTAAETDQASGSVQVVGSIAGVDTHGTVADGLGSLDVSGVFEVQKITVQTFTAGGTVYWNASGTPQGSVSGTGAATANVEDRVLGVCVKSTTTDNDERVWVELQQYAIPSS